MPVPMCQSDDGNAATFIGTFIETQQGVRVCDDCLPLFMATMFQEVTGVDMSPAIAIWTQASEQAEQVAQQAGEAAQAALAEAEATAAGGDPPVPAPADQDQAADDPGMTSENHSGATGGPSPEADSTAPGTEAESPPVEGDPAQAGAA